MLNPLLAAIGELQLEVEMTDRGHELMETIRSNAVNLAGQNGSMHASIDIHWKTSMIANITIRSMRKEIAKLKKELNRDNSPT